jgi:hypothetical protein
VLESKIQSALIKDLESKGYYVIKLSVTNKNGIPDILALPPGCNAEFYEVKQKGKQPKPIQKFRINEIKKGGFGKTFVHDGTTREA